VRRVGLFTFHLILDCFKQLERGEISFSSNAQLLQRLYLLYSDFSTEGDNWNFCSLPQRRSIVNRKIRVSSVEDLSAIGTEFVALSTRKIAQTAARSRHSSLRTVSTLYRTL